jgi:sterol desaturase/sphingolipid hydroxylase (fatty acid hydroxylase superfamily)
MHLHHHLRSWFFLFVVVSVSFEVGWYLLAQKRAYPWRELLASAGAYVLRAPARLLRPVLVAPAIYLVWSHRIATVPVGTPWGLALLLLGVELAYYWMHRSAHRLRWMWASHQVHHTPEHIHFASAFRLGATEVLSGNWLFYLPLYWLGFDPLAVSGALAVNLLYQFWLHTDLVGRLGWLEWVLNTPSHHRVHHASNPEYLDRNFGGVLIVFDRLFGTFAEERRGIRIRYGLVHPIGSLNPLRIDLHEWIALGRDAARARSWPALWRALFGRPGETSEAPRLARAAEAIPAE